MGVMENIQAYWNGLVQYGFELEHPERIWYIVPIMLIFLFFLRKQMVGLREKNAQRDEKVRKRIRLYRVLLFFSRTLIFLLLVIALASPILNVKEKVLGERSITLLVDRSDSMQVYDTAFVGQLQSELEQQMPVKVANIGTGKRSNIGDGILGNVRRNSNLLLVTDGNANAGSELGDAAIFAAQLNASISAIELVPVKNDYSVIIEGPNKVLSYSDIEYRVIVMALDGFDENFEPRIRVDDTEIVPSKSKLDENTIEYRFSKMFDDGQHKIEARIATGDYFQENNAYYKTVKSVPKPKVLLVSKKSGPVETILQKLYDVEKQQSLPSSLEEYYAVILDDVQAGTFSSADVLRLGEFVSDGNGLIVIGGDNSFEYGKYTGSQLLSLLPVEIGVGEKQPRPDLNAVVIIDISEGQAGFNSLGLSKAHAINILEQFRPNDNVGVVAFSEQYYTVSAMNKMTSDHKADIIDKIQRLQFVPVTECSNIRVCSNIVAGITGATRLLEGVAGSKWAFLYSDGQYFDYLTGTYIDWAVDELGSRNIVLYSTMTTETKIGDISYSFEGAERALRNLAEGTRGIYFGPSDSDRMRLLFGKQPDKEQAGEGEYRSLMVLDRYHFITEDLEPTAKITGYNQIVPKANGRLLMTTSMGDPLLVVWRYGVGRVAVLGTDDGTAWAGQLLNQDNSRLISRLINWGIGDPERKLEVYTQVNDGIVNESVEVIVKSKKYPKSEDLSFYKIDEDLYSATFRPSSLGIGTIAGNIFAANYALEYEKLSWNQELDNIISTTEGKIFKSSQGQEIVDFVNRRSERVDIQSKKMAWPFIAAAVFIFLVEVLARRIYEQVSSE